MIGWEYPPHNSGGLGVACQGMTEALAAQNTQIYFTLPYPVVGASVQHMNVLECSDPAWFAHGQANQPPFLAYSSVITPPAGVKGADLFDRHKLEVLPQSQMEAQVDRYAELVTDTGMQMANKIDGIHAHDWMSFPAAMALANKIRKPFIAHIHSTEMDRIPSGYGSPYIIRTEYEGMLRATKVIAVSFYTKNILVSKYGIDPDKIEVVHNGISPLRRAPDISKQQFAPNRPVIVFMGRLTMQKGADYFVALARNVLKKIPEALFVVAGSGDMYHQLLLQTAGEKLSASLLFSGFVRDKQQALLLDRADVFVMPSLSEPFGLVALEAAQRHTPVIVSKNAGVQEVMPSSIQVDFWDLNKMSEEIVRLIGKPSYAESVIKQQLEDLAQNNWQNSAEKLRNVYKGAFSL